MLLFSENSVFKISRLPYVYEKQRTCQVSSDE